MISELRDYCVAILRSYSVIFFSQESLLGGLLLVSTFAKFQFGLFGLVGVSMAYLAAKILGFDRDKLQNGFFLFNSLLISLALAYLISWQPISWYASIALLLAVSVGGLFISVACEDLFSRYFALPSLSFPFTLCGLGLFYFFHGLQHIPLSSNSPAYLIPSISGLPVGIEALLEAFSSIFFMPHTSVGLVVLVGVFLWSRLAVFYALIAYFSGIVFMHSLGMDIRPEALHAFGFNLVFCGIALGGVLLIPSRASLLIVVLSACLCVMVVESSRIALGYLRIPPLAMPFNFVVFGILYALKCREKPSLGLVETPINPEQPEKNFREFSINQTRFPGMLEPHLFMPFFGDRTVTQSFNGDITHRGYWSEALDFEIVDDLGHKFERFPLDLEGNFLYGTPVLAPCDGTVVKVVDDVPDNAINEIDTDRNWGNLVIIRSQEHWSVKLCHLQEGTVKVREGEHVSHGKVVAYCGNSGRSPVPHLHMHVQVGEIIGSPTHPFRMARYFAKDVNADGDAKWCYHSSGIPRLDDTVSPASFDPGVSVCFEFSEFLRTFKMDDRTETIRCVFDPAGNRVLSSDKATLTARIKHHTFYTYNYQGSSDSILYWLHLGLARVPFVSGENFYWCDHIDLRPLLRPWLRVFSDLISPFIGFPMVELKFDLQRKSGGSINVSSFLKYPVPRWMMRTGCPNRIDVELSNIGIESIETT